MKVGLTQTSKHVSPDDESASVILLPLPLSVSFHTNRLRACKTGPKDQIRNWSGEHLLFSLVIPPCCHSLDAVCPFHPSAPATLKQLRGGGVLISDLSCRRAGLNPSSLSPSQRNVTSVYLFCGLCVSITAALSPCCCPLYRTACAHVDGKRGVRAARPHQDHHSIRLSCLPFIRRFISVLIHVWSCVLTLISIAAWVKCFRS